MKIKGTGLGLMVPKKMSIGNVTFYRRQGQLVARVSESFEKRSNTLAQFKQRQRISTFHTDAGAYIKIVSK